MNGLKKVLIVEDEVLIARVYSSHIKKLGIAEAYTSTNLSSALELMNKNTFDLYILDVNLKDGENGIELAELIRKKFHQHIIFTTGNSNPEIDLKLKAIENTSVLLKPVNFEYFIRIVKENLELLNP